MEPISYSPAVVEVVAGFLMSLALEYIPGIKTVWSKASYHALILLGFFELVTLGWWALACWAGVGLPATPFACGLAGVGPAFIAGVVGFAGTQVGWLTVSRKSANAQDRAEEQRIEDRRTDARY